MRRGVNLPMKQIYTIFILTFLLVSSNLPILAQRKVAPAKSLKTENIVLEYENIQAYSDGRGVWIDWQTKVEHKNLGFYVYRLNNGEKELVSSSLVQGSYLQSREETSFGGKYNYFDKLGGFQTGYIIESFDADGARIASNVIYPKYINDLTQVAGKSSETLSNAVTPANNILQNDDLNLTKELVSEVEENQSLANINTHRAVVAMPGVKIGIKQEGFYRVTRTQLQNGGFNVNSDAANWQLYLEGVQQAINVGNNGDYIEFYGKGIDTLETDTRNYNLVVGTSAGSRIGVKTLRNLQGTVLAKGFAQTTTKKEKLNYASGILNGEADNYFGTPIVTSSNTNITFNLDKVDRSKLKSSFTLKIQGLTATSHNVNVTLNGEPLDGISGIGAVAMSNFYQIPTVYLLDGTNTLQLRATVGTSIFDNVSVSFNREYTTSNNKISFYTQNYRGANVKGFTSANIRIFDITDQDSPQLITNPKIQQNETDFSAILPSYRGRVMYGIEDSGIMSPASIVENIPSSLSTTNHDGTLVIITHKDLMTQANDWATYRRNQGTSVEVVDITDVFDEFNYSNFSSDSIKNFLLFAETNWNTPPQYVLILGDGSYDSRNYSGLGYWNMVPTKLVDTIYSETGSDEALADFNNDGLSEIAIGRISVRTGADVTKIFNKVTAFEANLANTFNRGAVFAYDLPNGYDFQGLSQRVAQQLPATMNKAFIGRGTANDQANLMTELNSGKYIVNYSGHGNASVWAASSFFGNSNVPQLNNTNQSIFVMLTCLNGYFINPASESLSELLLRAQNNNLNTGAVAVWSSTGLTTPDVQEVMATRFYGQLSNSNMTRIGDLIKDAKSTVVGGRDVRLSWALLGDPMLKVK